MPCCRFHKKNHQTLCKRTIRMRAAGPEAEEQILVALLFELQAEHIRMQLSLQSIPPAIVVEAQKLSNKPPAILRTDEVETAD